MNEFEQKDYEGARNCANAIKNNADNIMGIFDEIDYNMKNLYGDAWQSQGADAANERYQEIRKNYEVFYNRVISMKKHVDEVTSRNEAADVQVRDRISEI